MKPKRPIIVCLCGSTRFMEYFNRANFDETMDGKIVLTIGCNFKTNHSAMMTYNNKKRLDELHKRKIDLADEVFILNVNGYIGESTKSEIEYAKENGKKIRYLERIVKYDKCPTYKNNPECAGKKKSYSVRCLSCARLKNKDDNDKYVETKKKRFEICEND